MRMANFNGYNLPDMPEYIRGKYPYAVIVYEENSLFESLTGVVDKYYALYVMDQPCYVGTISHADDDGTVLYSYYGLITSPNMYADDARFTYCRWTANLGNTAWSLSQDSKTDSYIELDGETITGKIVWTNYDIMDEAGNVYMAAMKEPPRAGQYNLAQWIAAYMIGVADGYVKKKTAPIAYLYNGVRLPALPEWDRERYPYAVITLNKASNKYELYLFAENAYYFDSTYVYFGGSSSGEPVPAIIYTGTPEQGWYSQSEVDNANVCVSWQVVSKLIWSNIDLEYEGTMYLAASTPIPIYNEPVNYLYNGVQLPKLPEWDKTVYPYAVIYSPAVFGIVSDDYSLAVTSAPLFASGGTTNALKSTDTVTYRKCSYDAETDTWKQLGDEVTGTFDQTCAVRWANYEVLYADGTICTEASEPVPIYE